MIGVIKKLLLALSPKGGKYPKSPHLQERKPIRIKWHDGRILEFKTRRELTEYFYLHGKVSTHVIREVDKTKFIRTYEQHRIK